MAGTKQFQHAHRLLNDAERRFQVGEPIGPSFYLLRLVLEDLETLTKKKTGK
jgi:hypothetical protein